MAIKINNKVQRNLQEQVAKNAQDITDFLSGIGYMGPYSTTSAIPTTDYKEGQLYIVGTTSTTWHIYKYDETDGFTDLGAAPYLKDQTTLLDSLQSQITSNDTDISALQTRATTAESNISSLQSEVTTVKNTYVPETDFTATVEELEDDIATNKTDITAIKADYVTTDTEQTVSGDKTFSGKITVNGAIADTNSVIDSSAVSQQPTYGVTITYASAVSSNGKINVVLAGTIEYTQEIYGVSIFAFVVRPDIYESTIFPVEGTTVLITPIYVFQEASLTYAGALQVRARYDSSINNHAYDNLLRIEGLTVGETYAFRCEYSIALADNAVK